MDLSEYERLKSYDMGLANAEYERQQRAEQEKRSGIEYQEAENRRRLEEEDRLRQEAKRQADEDDRRRREWAERVRAEEEAAKIRAAALQLEEDEREAARRRARYLAQLEAEQRVAHKQSYYHPHLEHRDLREAASRPAYIPEYRPTAHPDDSWGSLIKGLLDREIEWAEVVNFSKQAALCLAGCVVAYYLVNRGLLTIGPAIVSTAVWCYIGVFGFRRALLHLCSLIWCCVCICGAIFVVRYSILIAGWLNTLGEQHIMGIWQGDKAWYVLQGWHSLLALGLFAVLLAGLVVLQLFSHLFICFWISMHEKGIFPPYPEAEAWLKSLERNKKRLLQAHR